MMPFGLLPPGMTGERAPFTGWELRMVSSTRNITDPAIDAWNTRLRWYGRAEIGTVKDRTLTILLSFGGTTLVVLMGLMDTGYTFSALTGSLALYVLTAIICVVLYLRRGSKIVVERAGVYDRDGNLVPWNEMSGFRIRQGTGSRIELDLAGPRSGRSVQLPATHDVDFHALVSWLNDLVQEPPAQKTHEPTTVWYEKDIQRAVSSTT